jgi:hypothetical protein
MKKNPGMKKWKYGKMVCNNSKGKVVRNNSNASMIEYIGDMIWVARCIYPPTESLHVERM